MQRNHISHNTSSFDILNILHLVAAFQVFWVNQAIEYASQHKSVPVPSQDKLGGLRQEGHTA